MPNKITNYTTLLKKECCSTKMWPHQKADLIKDNTKWLTSLRGKYTTRITSFKCAYYTRHKFQYSKENNGNEK
jgi:hypothetical protein